MVLREAVLGLNVHLCTHWGGGTLLLGTEKFATYNTTQLQGRPAAGTRPWPSVGRAATLAAAPTMRSSYDSPTAHGSEMSTVRPGGMSHRAVGRMGTGSELAA